MSPRQDRDPDASRTDGLPLLPAAGEAGEDTMSSIDAGLLGSSGYRASSSTGALKHSQALTPSGEDAVEAELVDAQDESSVETVQFDADTMAHLRAAARRLGDFELERKVGQGGMGEVWLARQVSLDRPVAVKVLPRQLATQENFIERFQREAKAAASLVHPNVIQIYAYGIDEGTPYFAMEYVEGEDLQQRIRRERFLDWGEIVDILMGVGSALSVAHDKGLIHRDIKPSNVMIDRNGIVKVMDFGLAKATSGGPEAKSLTNAGLIMGTPNYLSPEQGRGDPLDGRSDLYSLGIVLYELLTGTLPFKADTPAGLIFKHVYEPPPPPCDLRPEVPPFLAEITLRLLEKDPDDRYRNAQEFLADLAEFYDNYDYYVDEAGERRPQSGYLDPQRVEGVGPKRLNTSGGIAARGRGSGRSTNSTSSRRNAVTEGVTGPVRRSEREPQDEELEATLPPGEDYAAALRDEDDDATLDSPTGGTAGHVRFSGPKPATAERGATAAATKERQGTAERDRPREREERERERRPVSRRVPPPPPRRSKLPLVALLLLIAGGAGFGYAWTFHNEQTREVMTRLGLLKKPQDPLPQPSPGPSGSPGGQPSPVDTSVAVTPSPAPNGTASPEPSGAPSPGQGEVLYAYPVARWAEGVGIELARAKHDPYALRRGSSGSYPLGDDYRITFTRRGYEPISFEVRLGRSESSAEQGILLDAAGRDVAARELTWSPTPTLREAYEQGRSAIERDDLTAARTRLGAAAQLDPDYRPQAEPGQVAPSVQELLERVRRREEELQSAQERLQGFRAMAEGHVKERRWRAALQVLEQVPEADRPAGWKDLVERCRQGTRAGDVVASTGADFLAQGSHDKLERQLTTLGDVDPEHPELRRLRDKLAEARALRAKALQPPKDTPIEQVLAALENYLERYGPDDVQAKARAEEVRKQIGASRTLQLELGELRRLAREKRWTDARRKANQILAGHPESGDAQEVLAQAEEELAREELVQTVGELDAALVKGDVGGVLALMDPESDGARRERAALERLAWVQGRFLASAHPGTPKINIQGALAQLTVPWEFQLTVLGQPPRAYTTTHVVQLRRVGKRWLILELRAQGGVRAR